MGKETEESRKYADQLLSDFKLMGVKFRNGGKGDAAVVNAVSKTRNVLPYLRAEGNPVSIQTDFGKSVVDCTRRFLPNDYSRSDYIVCPNAELNFATMPFPGQGSEPPPILIYNRTTPVAVMKQNGEPTVLGLSDDGEKSLGAGVIGCITRSRVRRKILVEAGGVQQGVCPLVQLGAVAMLSSELYQPSYLDLPPISPIRPSAFVDASALDAFKHQVSGLPSDTSLAKIRHAIDGIFDKGDVQELKLLP